MDVQNIFGYLMKATEVLGSTILMKENITCLWNVCWFWQAYFCKQNHYYELNS